LGEPVKCRETVCVGGAIVGFATVTSGGRERHDGTGSRVRQQKAASRMKREAAFDVSIGANDVSMTCQQTLRLLFGSAGNNVEVLDELVNVNAVSHSALFEVFEVSGSAAEAAHTGVDEDFNRIRVLLNDLENAHIFGNSSHEKGLLCF